MTTLRPNAIDLHCHTSRSDGVEEPLALYEHMRRAGMRLVAITDHDTLVGYRELRAAGLGATPSAAGPELVSGIEINTIADEVLRRYGMGRDGEELHILGFGIADDDPTLAATLERQRRGRLDRVRLTVERLATLGLPIDDGITGRPGAELSAGRPHVARAMVRAGYVASVDEAFERYLGHGAPAYVARLGIGPREAIEAVRAAGGLPVLAHSPAAPDRPEVIAELQDWGLAGLEVFYRSFLPDTVERMAAFAAERGLLATGGSDYHGDLMSYAETQRLTHVPDAVGERLLAALAALAASPAHRSDA